MFSLLLNLVNLTVSFAFPTFTTYKALSSHNSDSFKPLVIYWLVFAGLSILEFNFFFLLKYVPFYSLIRLYISFWLILPNTKGADFIYYNYVNPFFNEHEKYIENSLKNFSPKDILNLLGIKKFSRFPAKSSSVPEDGTSVTSVFDKFIENLNRSSGTVESKDSFWGSLAGVLYTSFNEVEKSQDSVSNKPLNSEPTAINTDFDLVGTEDIDSYDGEADVTISAPSTPQTGGWFSYLWGSSASGVTKDKEE